jgi:hypothetical protein
VAREKGVDLLDAQLRLARDGLRADDAVHPGHVALHARHDRGPLRGGITLRIGQHVALLAGEAKRLALGQECFGNDFRIERGLGVTREVSEQPRHLGVGRGLDAGHQVGHQPAHVAAPAHALDHALYDLGPFRRVMHRRVRQMVALHAVAQREPRTV